ncbi:hypothetical protein SmJEL517_g01126 [Synchytrium microbalum]|uniref:Serine aminopeptidase S33 domain-containing protein n=1 Tax=Synchytrium microbalum TaxID=1806994 RepID=A0A507CGJ7_9FUNG|nr:uncharacterized protein SmJEL517_g01126 [Synchytrium microbalum]TPX36755.1 hypothetical protein SmJEL517_g01126 [Synchytrium microbalum]
MSGKFIDDNQGNPLYIKTWSPAGKPVASVLFVHGLGEHIGRYDHVFPIFAEKHSIKVTGLDYAGHGRTVTEQNGIQGFTPFDTVIEQLELVMSSIVIPGAEGAPVFVMGHSLGGLLSTYFTSLHWKTYNVKGLVLSAPAVVGTAPVFDEGFVPPPDKEREQFANGLPLDGLSRDPKVIEAYKNDPFVHGFLTLRLAFSIFQARQHLQGKGRDELTLPIMLLHGTQDKLVPVAPTVEFINSLPAVDKTVITMSPLYHEPHNEPEQAEVINYYVNWILSRATTRTPL